MFKVGDRVVQIEQDYSTTKIGWRGTIISGFTKNESYVNVIWDNDGDMGSVQLCHLRPETKLEQVLK